ncbi:putative cyclin A [Monocercomonoides exilis]|uniref:putative cyclin A n=1 Tax=Monocercomonoides exilis TaxID=2049356 RepID=UPI00355994E8|nr:putative cyclin A [Monocercomonoides exilis]|eukprot:MONOS_10707.1-p1 / transcript=MONOS_10707.1 / gene=MONOS_10707 / organism=Monocercomonoides_exilis_PA203 / gene_product=cyclin A / transcript_product=cyclin A / location=Mono_scaffold00497:14982-19150(-) / protein_length=827 / sequence_SO=supercontig / SO=protein_coding / is_pseudo=false
MRAVLIDWLADVNNEFRFHPETLFLCVNFIDRFLSAVPVRRGRLQLLGITSLFVAAKFEESVIPPVKDSFLWACDSSVTSEELMKMEQFLLNTLHFSLCAVTPHHFIHRFLKATAYASPDTPVLAFYYLELSLLDHSMLCFLPSEIAASSVWLACFTTLSAQHRATLKEHTISQKEGENVDKEEMPFSGQGEFQSEEELYGQIWTPTLEHYTSHTLSELVDCIVAIHHFANSLAASPNLHLGSITIKYSRQKYLKVAERYPSMPDLPNYAADALAIHEMITSENLTAVDTFHFLLEQLEKNQISDYTVASSLKNSSKPAYLQFTIPALIPETGSESFLITSSIDDDLINVGILLSMISIIKTQRMTRDVTIVIGTNEGLEQFSKVRSTCKFAFPMHSIFYAFHLSFSQTNGETEIRHVASNGKAPSVDLVATAMKKMTECNLPYTLHSKVSSEPKNSQKSLFGDFHSYLVRLFSNNEFRVAKSFCEALLKPLEMDNNQNDNLGRIGANHVWFLGKRDESEPENLKRSINRFERDERLYHIQSCGCTMMNLLRSMDLMDTRFFKNDPIFFAISSPDSDSYLSLAGIALFFVVPLLFLIFSACLVPMQQLCNQCIASSEKEEEEHNQKSNISSAKLQGTSKSHQHSSTSVPSSITKDIQMFFFSHSFLLFTVSLTFGIPLFIARQTVESDKKTDIPLLNAFHFPHTSFESAATSFLFLSFSAVVLSVFAFRCLMFTSIKYPLTRSLLTSSLFLTICVISSLFSYQTPHLWLLSALYIFLCTAFARSPGQSVCISFVKAFCLIFLPLAILFVVTSFRGIPTYSVQSYFFK